MVLKVISSLLSKNSGTWNLNIFVGYGRVYVNKERSIVDWNIYNFNLFSFKWFSKVISSLLCKTSGTWILNIFVGYGRIYVNKERSIVDLNIYNFNLFSFKWF